MGNLQSLSHFWPELILTATIVVAIFVDLFSGSKPSSRVGLWVLGGLVLTGLAIRLTNGGPAITLFMDSIALDPFARFFKVIILVATAFVILASQRSEELRPVGTGEYYSLLAILVFGLFLMVSAIDLIMVYLSIEIVSIASFILAGYLKKDKRSSEAALKYVIYGAFSTGIMLFGLSILFGLAGDTNFFAIQEAISSLDGKGDFALILATVFILAGFGYKISAVPFHFWTPDVYEGAPITITAYLSVAPKAAGFAMIIRFFHQVFSDSGALQVIDTLSSTGLPWPQVLAVLAVVTMTMGNLVAIQQTNIKRMLAYSSIAHAGYMLMALPMLSRESIYGIMVYLVMYLFMNLGAFFVVMTVKHKTGGETFEDFHGIGWKMPIIGGVMTIFMLSLTGLPPTAGFIGKFYIFAAVIKGGPQYYWLALAGALNSVVSLYYYMRVINALYLKGEPQDELVYSSPLTTFLLVALAVPSLVFGIYWAPIANWVNESLVLFTQIM